MTTHDTLCLFMTLWTFFPNRLKVKAHGPDGLFMESFIYACPALFAHLSLFFSSCVNHGFLPNKLSEVITTHVVKNKGGDLTDANNYRAIALSNVDTKILERLMLPQITSFDSTSDKYQLGFKSIGIRHHSVQMLSKKL